MPSLKRIVFLVLLSVSFIVVSQLLYEEHWQPCFFAMLAANFAGYIEAIVLEALQKLKEDDKSGN